MYFAADQEIHGSKGLSKDLARFLPRPQVTEMAKPSVGIEVYSVNRGREFSVGAAQKR